MRLEGRAAGMAQNQLWVPYDGELSWPINEPKRRAAIEAMARALARFLGLRSRLYLRRGLLETDADSDSIASPMQDHHDSQHTILSGLCAACRRRPALVGRALCGPCRNIQPELVPGPTFVEAMYSCSHPNLVLTPETVQTITRLFKKQSFVFEAMRQSKAFEMMALGVLNDSVNRASDGNFFFPASWTANPQSPFLSTMRYPHRTDVHHARGERGERGRVKVGGLGPRLCAHVIALVANWLRRVDDMHREAFADLASSTTPTDVDVQMTIDYFADLIARRVTRTEIDDVTSPRLEVATLEAEAEKRFVHARQRATAEVRRDLGRMFDLRLVLSPDAEDAEKVLASPARREGVATLLTTPPPELRASRLPLSSLVDVGALAEALVCTDRFGAVTERAAAVRAILAAALNPSCLHDTLAEAIQASSHWQHPRNFFLAVVQRQRHDAAATAAVGVPAPPWVHARDEWVYRHAEPWMRARQRIGLDLTSLRIVLLSSMLIEMLASERSPFEAGLLKAEHVVAVAGPVYENASSASRALCEQLRPLLAGVEYAQARTAVLQSQCNHLDADVQLALCPLSHFSIRDLMTCFWPRSPLFPSLAYDLIQSTKQHMIIKPEPGYEEFVQTSLALFLPIISSMRLALGANCLTDGMHELGDVLRTLPAFREWCRNGGEGALVLSKEQVRAGGSEAPATLESWARRGAVVRWMRYQNRVMRFVFHREGLEMVMGAAPAGYQ